jgi:PAS domain S-box-containing protein
MYGYVSKEEVLLLELSDLSANDHLYNNETAFMKMQKALTEGQQNFEWLSKRKDGATFWIELTLSKKIIGGKERLMAIGRDITERKKAEEELKRKNELFDSLINNLPRGVFMVEAPSGKPLIANSKAKELLGRGVLPGASKHNLDKVYKAYKNNTNSIYPLDEMPIIKGIKGETSYVDNMLVVRPDGTQTLLEVYGSPVRDQNGNVWASLVSFSDISERKKAEEKLKANYSLLRIAGETAKFGGWIVDLKEDRCIWSDVVAAIHGVPAGFSPNIADAIDFYPSEWHEKINQLFSDCAQKGIPYDEELQILTAQGKKIWVRATAEPVRDENGQIVKVQGSFQDIDERKKAEMALTESEHKFKTLFSSMSEMVVLHDLVYDASGNVCDYRIIDCNESFTQVSECTREEAIGKLASEFYNQNPPPYLDIYSTVALTGEPCEFEIYYPPFDKYFRVSAVSPVKGNFATITNDITEIKRYNDMLIEKNKELENYVYITSHDLRSPLVNIQGFSGRLKKLTDMIGETIQTIPFEEEKKKLINENISEKIPATLDYIFTNVSKMETLLNGLLQISRTGRLPMNIVQINMQSLIKKIIQSVDFQLTEINASVEVSELPDCFGDESLLNQLFSNIIENAIKYRDASRPLSIQISGAKHQRKIIYKVKDNGIGISNIICKKSECFLSGRHKQSSGEGLGLSLANVL